MFPMRLWATCALTLLVTLAGCVSHATYMRQAREKLEADGMSDVQLVARENGFEFTAKDKAGNNCKGSITGSSSLGGTPHKVSSTCQPP
jgi:hypothetical protein